jgi:hypothetical protein
MHYSFPEQKSAISVPTNGRLSAAEWTGAEQLFFFSGKGIE